MNAHEELSAWMDGQATESRAEHVTKKILQDPESRARWNEYHLISDAMRSAALARKSNVADAVAQALESEPNHLGAAAITSEHRSGVGRRKISRMVSGLAVAAGLAFVVFVAVAPQMQAPGGPEQLAAGNPAIKTADSPAAVNTAATTAVLQDARLRELFDAHGSMSIRPVSTEVR
ncbi:MAG: sigma-E factor negative regulatory protein [Betaproteobacteria bacterium]